MNERTFRDLLEGYVDPSLGSGLESAGTIKKVEGLGSDRLTVTLEMPFPCDRYAAELEEALQQHCRDQLDDGVSVNFEISHRIEAHAVQAGVRRLDNVRNIIAVASGKGGVGKSTTSVNLALALATEGASVGLLDADIYGPSQPRMMGLGGHPESLDGKTLEPLENYGVQSMSIGYLVEQDTPMIWRGPMVTGALEQLLADTNWRDLDYLIIDMPPGTGDIQLTLTQKVPVSGALIVTTPQDIALLDARKGLKMFEKVNVPVLGVVENMSTHICSQCGHQEPIFGEGGGAQMADEAGVELLGQLPLELRIREQADGGQPTVVAEPDCTSSSIYRQIARRAAARLSQRSKDYSTRFPKIVVQNT